MSNYNDLVKYNGFYKDKNAREVILKLSKNKCCGCSDKLKLNDLYHIGHIIPQKDSKIFIQYYPELDVDNILNLHALCSKCNLKANSSQTYSTFMLNQMFNENYRNITNRLDKIISELEYSKLYDILSFLQNNKQIDLFDDKGKKYINYELQEVIKFIINFNKMETIYKEKKLEYIKLNFNTILKDYSEFYMIDSDIKIVNKKINSLIFTRLLKHIKDKELVILKNKNKINKLQSLIENLGKNI